MNCLIVNWTMNNSVILLRIQSFYELHIDYKIHLIYEFYKGRTRTTRTTIFKLIGPCEILSHGQKSFIFQICEKESWKCFEALECFKVTDLDIHSFFQSRSCGIHQILCYFCGPGQRCSASDRSTSIRVTTPWPYLRHT